MTPERRSRQDSSQTGWELVGGVPGLAQSSLPSAVFVLADESFGLRTGIVTALGVGVAFAALRALRKQPLRPVFGGLVGLAISSFIAWRTGSARNYFLPDIWFSLACACVLAASVVARRPLVGVVWNAMSGTSTAWRRDPPSLIGYQIATATLAVMYTIRFAVQQWLYARQATGWMVVAKICVNYPLWALALCVAAWAVRRSDRRLPDTRK